MKKVKNIFHKIANADPASKNKLKQQKAEAF